MSDNEEIDTLSDVEDEHIDVGADEVDPMNYVIGLIKLSKNIIKLKDMDDGIQRRSRRPPVLQKLINYEKAISKLEFDDLVPSIFEIYKTHRKTILKDDHSWLLSSDLAFDYIKPGTKPKSYKQRNEICISRIYQMAGEMFEKHSHDKVTGGRNKYNYIPTSFIRYLYLLFLESIESNKDQDILGKLIDKAETQLGITDGSYTEDFENDLLGSGLFSGNFKGGIEKIMKVVFEAFKKNDINIPEGMNIDKFNFNDITNIASKLFDSEDPFISEILKDIGKCDNSVDLAKSLMSKLKDPVMLKKIMTVLGVESSDDKISEFISTNEETISTLIQGSFPTIKEKADSLSKSEAPELVSLDDPKQKTPIDTSFVDSKPIQASPLPAIETSLI